MSLKDELRIVQNLQNLPSLQEISKMKDLLKSAAERTPNVNNTNIDAKLFTPQMERYLKSEGLSLKRIKDERDGDYFIVSW